MLLYLLEHRSDPFHWSDIEALPLYLFGFLVLAGMARIAITLPGETQATLVKVLMILMLVGLRFVAGGDPARDGAPTATANA